VSLPNSAACVMKLALLLFVCSSATMAQHIPPRATLARWPEDRLAAISLTFDDGMNTQLDNAGPILKQHQLTGTFFVSTGLGPWEKRKPEWKGLARGGNELANHTVKHPCLLEEIEPHSQNYTPEMMQSEISSAANEIKQAISSQRGFTFAFPCGDMSFGTPGEQVRNAALYMRYVSENSFGARAFGAGAPNDPDDLSVLTISDLGPTAGKDFAGLLKLAEPAIQSHFWGVFTFHGIGGEWLSVSTDALDKLAAYLQTHREIWTAPFGDVLRYTQERKAASLYIRRSDNHFIDIALHWPLDAQIYDLPLTVKVEIPAVWTGITAAGDAKRLETKVIAGMDRTVVLVNVSPGTNYIHITR
jgi:peptidoglycan/xylan/chitin deacetylase (PgdA/CDA1 family)